MKAQDLRLGNFVIAKNEIIKIIEFRESFVLGENDNSLIRCLPSQMKPIELTEEVLLKIGFKKEEKMHCILYYLDYEINEDDNICVRYIIYNSKVLPLLRITSPSPIVELTKRGIKYLNELQNIYYCLIGNELEVKL